MANFDKKWSELSQEDSKAMKAKYGSKQAWQDAKAKAEGYKNETEKKTTKEQQSSQPVTDATSSANNMEGALKDKNGRIVGYTGAAAEQRNEERAEVKANQGPDPVEAFKKKFSYANATNRNEGQFADEYKQITSGMSNSERKEFQKDIYDDTRYIKKHGVKELQDTEGANVKEQMGMSGSYFSNASEYYENKSRPWEVSGPQGTGARDSETGEPLHSKYLASVQDSVNMLKGTGYDFSQAEVARHRDGGSQKNIKGLYDSYGGYDNWYNNYSAYSEKGFTGSNDIKTGAEIYEYNKNRSKIYDDYMQGRKEKEENYWQSLQN